MIVTSQGRNKGLDDEIKKKQSRKSPDVQFKEFSLTKQTSRPRADYDRIGKTSSKKSIKKLKKKHKLTNVKEPPLNQKPLARNGNLVLKKQNLK